jgi:hypothetical protein
MKDSVDLDDGMAMRPCMLYQWMAYEFECENQPLLARLTDEERRRKRDEDTADFLDWFWPERLHRGHDEFEQLHEFVIENELGLKGRRLDCDELKEWIRDAVEDGWIVPVIDRTEDWSGGCMPASSSQVPSTQDGILRISDDAFLSPAFSSGEPILSGPYDPLTQEAKLKAARAGLSGHGSVGNQGFDWLRAVETVAATVSGNADNDNNAVDFASALSNAQAFEYDPGPAGDDAFKLTNVPRSEMYACDIISNECKGSVLREFPSQYLDSTYNDIQNDARDGLKDARKALKLLNDNRFKK